MFLIATAEAYVARNRLNQAALFGALATLTRPDALVLPVLIALYDVAARRRIPWKPVAIFIAVLAPWLIFATAYFGSPLPLSITAKTQAYFHDPALALTTLTDFVVGRNPFSNARLPLGVLGLGLVVLLSLYVVGARAAWHAQRSVLPLAVYPPIYVLGLSLANPVIFVWYYPPLLVFLDALVLLGAAELIRAPRTRVRYATFLVVVMMLLVVQWRGVADLTARWPIDLRQRELVYEQAAADLNGLVKPGEKVALPEIGALGYALDRAYIIDTVGLVSPEAIPYLLKQPAPGQTFNYAISNESIAALNPAYVITLEIFARPTLLQSEDFMRAYQIVKAYDAHDFGSQGLLVFRRRGID